MEDSEHNREFSITPTSKNVLMSKSHGSYMEGFETKQNKRSQKKTRGLKSMVTSIYNNPNTKAARLERFPERQYAIVGNMMLVQTGF